MCRRKNKCSRNFSLQLSLHILSSLLIHLPTCRSFNEANFLKSRHVLPKLLRSPYKSLLEPGSPDHRQFFKPIHQNSSTVSVIDGYLKIEPSDAIHDPKYSQSAITYAGTSHPVPSETSFQREPSPLPTHASVLRENLQSSLSSTYVKESSLNPQLSKESSQIVHLHQNPNASHDDNLQEFPFKPVPANDNASERLQLLPSSSENVLSYEHPDNYSSPDGDKQVIPSKKSSERAIDDLPSHHLDNSKFIYSEANSSTQPSVIPDLVTYPPFIFHSHISVEVVNQTNPVDDNITTVPPSYGIDNTSSSSASFSNDIKLSAGSVAGIVIGVLVCTTIVSSTVIYLLYQKYNGNCTGVVEGKFNSDNCGYLDDSLRSSIYLNNHIELPKESSEEMSSLDNDSFLNSLETMTIQNYWTDSSKNTKV